MPFEPFGVRMDMVIRKPADAASVGPMDTGSGNGSIVAVGLSSASFSLPGVARSFHVLQAGIRVQRDAQSPWIRRGITRAHASGG